MSPVINGCANALDSWEILRDGTLTYRFAVNLDGATCKVTRKRLSSADIHELTRERAIAPGRWHWGI